MPSLASARRVHLVGIGGSGMAALAHLLLGWGKEVSGCDAVASPATDALARAGASICLGHAAEHVRGAEYVIRSSAVASDHPEVVAAARHGQPSVKLADAVGEIMAGRRGVAVAGTHGKTTTTALVAWLLHCGGHDPMALIGAESLNFEGSARAGDGPMVVEADEYDRRFLTLWPEVAVVTSVEPDHLDYFRDVQEIRDVFQEFVGRLPAQGRLVVCLDDPGAAALATGAQRDTYGFGRDADWRATDYTAPPGGGSRFRLHVGSRVWEAESSLVGEHNVRNALAALAAADHFGVGLQAALAALPRFRGTRRRFETKGKPGDVWVVDDYAHHPTAVAATLRAARQAVPRSGRGAVWAVFQPHTTHRTAALLEPFAAAFRDADHVLVLPVYEPRGREAAARPISAADLAAAIQANGHPDARAVPGFREALVALGRDVRAGDVVLTMGAGDVTTLSDDLVRSLGSTVGSPSTPPPSLSA